VSSDDNENSTGSDPELPSGSSVSSKEGGGGGGDNERLVTFGSIEV
jgi:hypothetical protein